MSRRGQPPGDPLDSIGFEVLVEEYLSWVEVHGYSSRTVRSYSYTIAVFVRWCYDRGITRPSEVTYPILQRYQRWLYYYRGKKGRPLSVRTQHLRLSHLRGLFRWLVREHHILYNPSSEIQLPKIPRQLPRDALSAAEADELLDSVEADTPLGLRDRAAMETLYSTGIRRFELINLDLHDVDRDRRLVMVRGGKGGRDRVVPIGERAVAWVDRYLVEARPEWVTSDDQTALFVGNHGERLTPAFLTFLVTKRVKESGVRQKGSCHLFRHSMATLMLENGADIRYIQEILGHSTLETTQIYTKVSVRHLQRIHDATHPAGLLERRRPEALEALEGARVAVADRNEV